MYGRYYYSRYKDYDKKINRIRNRVLFGITVFIIFVAMSVAIKERRDYQDGKNRTTNFKAGIK